VIEPNSDREPVAQLTGDETRLARAALVHVLFGPYAIPDSEFHTLLGFTREEAQALEDSLGEALGERIGEVRDGMICAAMFFPPSAVAQLDRWKQTYGERLGPIDDWQIDIGRSARGDLARVWIPEGREPSP
jgi:hypothetical protein